MLLQKGLSYFNYVVHIVDVVFVGADGNDNVRGLSVAGDIVNCQGVVVVGANPGCNSVDDARRTGHKAQACVRGGVRRDVASIRAGGNAKYRLLMLVFL